MTKRAQLIDETSLWKLCLSVSQEVFNNRRPSAEYSRNVATTLFMIAAHESDDLHANRQYGFQFSSGNGAHGIYQIEWGSALTSLKYIQARPELQKRVMEWLFQHKNADLMVNSAWYVPGGVIQKAVLYAIIGWPRCSVAFARLHLLRRPEIIPSSLQAMAEYAKDHFNTKAGKATPQKYLDAYIRHWPLVKEEGEAK